MRKRGISGGAFFALALAVSVTAHVWAFASLLQPRSQEFGSVDVATAAISVNLETTDVIDATEAAAAKEAASSPAGAPVEAAKETREKMPSDEGKPQADEQARPAAEADAERQLISPDKREAEVTEEEKKKRDKSQRSAAAGGAGTTGASDSEQSMGRVSASQGSILNYGASLRALISSNTPRTFRKTSLRVAFSIAPSGGLTAVGVIRPSSNSEADKRIVELVRNLSSRFPPPPAGATATQLTFNIEIIFR